MFCGTVLAKMFQEEYQQVDLDNLYGANEFPLLRTGSWPMDHATKRCTFLHSMD